MLFTPSTTFALTLQAMVVSGFDINKNPIYTPDTRFGPSGKTCIVQVRDGLIVPGTAVDNSYKDTVWQIPASSGSIPQYSNFQVCKRRIHVFSGYNGETWSSSQVYPVLFTSADSTTTTLWTFNHRELVLAIKKKGGKLNNEWGDFTKPNSLCFLMCYSDADLMRGYVLDDAAGRVIEFDDDKLDSLRKSTFSYL